MNKKLVETEEKSTKDRNIHLLIVAATDDDLSFCMYSSTFGCENAAKIEREN